MSEYRRPELAALGQEGKGRGEGREGKKKVNKNHPCKISHITSRIAPKIIKESGSKGPRLSDSHISGTNWFLKEKVRTGGEC